MLVLVRYHCTSLVGKSAAEGRGGGGTCTGPRSCYSVAGLPSGGEFGY